MRLPSQINNKLPEIPDKRSCTNKLCDPSPQAYKLAEQKANLRSLDARHPTHRLRAREFAKHLIAVENAQAVVDTSPPYVPKAHYHNMFATNLSGLLQSKIELNNARLLSRLAQIYSGNLKTGIETRLSPQTRCIRNRPYERAIKTMNLMNSNLKQFDWIKKQKPFYSTSDLSKWYSVQKRHKDRISKYPDVSKPKACPILHRRIMEKSLAEPRQYAYLMVETEDLVAENLVIELFADMCPFTVKNFQRLCINTKATACDCRTYRCKKVDRLHCVQILDGQFKKIYWVVGEHVDSTVEFTPMMLKECSPLSHTEAGLVTRPKGRAGGVFFITIGPCTHLDQFCYVFGRVVGNGMDYLRKMEYDNIEQNGSTIINMHVTDCGVVKNIKDVPPAMLLQDFISQVRLDIMPFIKRNPKNPNEWIGGKSTFADHLKQRADEKQKKMGVIQQETTNDEDDDDEDVEIEGLDVY